jgi:glycerophosphoryl diester phosphodiesterase
MARAPENTLGAFLAAIEDGAHGVELDVQLSADAIPIVLHDDTLDRTTSLTGLAIRFEACELEACDASSWFAGWGPVEKVPRLDEVLRALPAGSVVNVELKGPTPLALGLERRVLEVVRAHPHIGVIVSSFHPAQLLAVRTLAPEVPIGLLFAGDKMMPLRTAWAAPVLLPDALHPHSALVDRAFVTRARRAGMRVHAWGVPDEEEAARLLDLGVDGLIVDDVKGMGALLG